MKNILLFLLITASFPAFSQSSEKIERGTLEEAGYIIIIPENWNNNLIMYAHGYEFMGSQPRQSKNERFPGAMKPYLNRGFAVAASDYRIQGFAIPEGVDDTETLRRYFIKKYGQPDSTFMVGTSMGGGVTLAMMENYDKSYVAGFPMCALSSRPYLQVRKEYDLYATFNGLFPGITLSLKDIFDISKPLPDNGGNMFAEAERMKKEMMEKDSMLAKAFAKQFDLKIKDLPFTLFFTKNVLRDVAEKAQGNPFDNTNTVYSGFPNDLYTNQHAERLSATVSPDPLFDRYDRTGNINKPVLMMHTLYDQLIPPKYGVINFENMVHEQGKGDYLTVYYTNGQAHCAFSPEQIGKAFDDLRKWVNTGEKAKAGFLE